MNKRNAILPTIPEQRAVALAFAEVIRKRRDNVKLGDHPYASAFFRHFYGTSKPTKRKLTALVQDPSLTIPVITRDINLFLAQNGTGNALYFVKSEFAVKAFPSLANQVDNRFEQHLELKTQQKTQATNKANARQAKVKQSKCDSIPHLKAGQLSEWIGDNDTIFSELELKDALQSWFTTNGLGSQLDFHYEYSDLSAREIAYELSFTNLDFVDS